MDAPVAELPTPPGRFTEIEAVRSTLLCSGIAVLRSRELFDRYQANLDDDVRMDILGMVSGVWVPLSTAMKHFEACERLGLSTAEAFEVGLASGERIHATILKTLKTLASGVGASPWTVFEQYPRLWKRVFNGGGFSIFRAGPKEAVLHYRGLPMARFAYFRNAFRGVNAVGLRLFARTVYVHEERDKGADLRFRIAWV